MEKGLLIILSGPSGVGKGTVRKKIMQDKHLNLHFSISMTTRSPRNKEEDGVDYYFVSKEEFQKNLEQGNLLEHCEFVGNCYGTPKDKVEEYRNKGMNVFLEIEINGATQVMNNVKDPGLVTIFLMPPSLKKLEERIRARKTESDDIIQERLQKGIKEMAMSDRYQHVVLNDRVNRAAKEISNIIKSKMKELEKLEKE